MLRVRPVVSTSNLPRYGPLLAALGLRVATDDGACRVYDAGSGRVALRSRNPGSEGADTVALGFEVGDSPGDLAEFSRRTRQDGGAVDLIGQGNKRAARIAAPDGTTFLAVPGPRSTASPEVPLSVVCHWHTADPAAAATVLLAIGARSSRNTPDGTRLDFVAKNGGIIAVHSAPESSVRLGFEYHGDVGGLTGALASAGIRHSVVDRHGGRFLEIEAAGPTPLFIDERLPIPAD